MKHVLCREVSLKPPKVTSPSIITITKRDIALYNKIVHPNLEATVKSKYLDGSQERDVVLHSFSKHKEVAIELLREIDKMSVESILIVFYTKFAELQAINHGTPLMGY